MTDPLELLDQYRNGFAKRARAALRAVLDLHKSVDIEDGWDETIRTVCDDCCEPWPCPTVQAITTALEGADA